MENNEEIKNPEAVLAELRRAQEDLKNLRSELSTLREERDSLVKAKEDLAKQVEENPFRSRAIETATKLELGKMGLENPDRLLRYVGSEGIDFDEDGSLTGLDERVKQLKEDLPELFDVKRQVGGRADIFANDPAEKEKSTTESQVDALFNN